MPSWSAWLATTFHIAREGAAADAVADVARNRLLPSLR